MCVPNYFSNILYCCAICLKTTVYSSHRTYALMQLIFLAIFTVEAALRIFVLGKKYFQSGWNVFDFFIVGIDYVGIFVSSVRNGYLKHTSLGSAFDAVDLSLEYSLA